MSVLDRKCVWVVFSGCRPNLSRPTASAGWVSAPSARASAIFKHAWKALGLASSVNPCRINHNVLLLTYSSFIPPVLAVIGVMAIYRYGSGSTFLGGRLFLVSDSPSPPHGSAALHRTHEIIVAVDYVIGGQNSGCHKKLI